MRTIALISQKGGAGKSTLTINLAGIAVSRGRSVVIADADPQQSVVDWYKARRESAPMPYVASAHANQAKDVVERAAANGANFVFIDTSPNSTEESLAIAACADLLVVPCAPALIDLRALTRTKSGVDFASKPALAVLNRVPHDGNEADQAAAALRTISVSVRPHRTGDRPRRGVRSGAARETQPTRLHRRGPRLHQSQSLTACSTARMTSAA